MADPNTVETATFTIEGPDGETDELTVPTGLLDLLRDGDEPDPEVLGDVAMLSCAQQAHALVHHRDGEADAETQAIESATLSRFEERFGMSFAQATGHSH